MTFSRDPEHDNQQTQDEQRSALEGHTTTFECSGIPVEWAHLVRTRVPTEPAGSVSWGV